jgi:site-specific recombinase XerD
MAFTADLFAPPEDTTVLGSFQAAFASWRSASIAADRLQRASTLEVYEDMWGAFAAWCVAQTPQVRLESLTEQDLQRFHESRERARHDTLSARYAYRLFSLIDHVLARHALERGAPKNEAAAEYIRRSDEIRRANIGERPALDYLDAEQARRLVTYLADVRPGAAGARQVRSWQELRNLTAVALHLGAGLTPGDVRELPLDAPVVAGGRFKDVPWKLKVPGNGNRPPRETPVAPWAGRLLAQWLAARADARLPATPVPDGKGATHGPFLLPGPQGRPWSKMAHYEAVQKVMVAAGIDEPGGGSGGAFRLRHTFALRQLRRNHGVEDVARWMGIANIEEMKRYTGVLYGYAEPV